MLIPEQVKTSIKMKFICFGCCYGKMYFFNDSKKKRKFIISKNKGTRLVFGAIFLIENYEEIKHKLHSYYYSFEPFVGNRSEIDGYVLSKINVTPISFQSISNLKDSNYKKGNDVECFTFEGNKNNKIISHSINTNYYKISKGVNKNLIEKIREWNTKKE